MANVWRWLTSPQPVWVRLIAVSATAAAFWLIVWIR